MAKTKRKRKVKSSQMKLRDKADKLITEIYKNNPCEVCLSFGNFNNHKTCGHHVVNKSLSSYLRHEPENIVAVCESHHTFGATIAPHSSWTLAIEAFNKWLKKHRPKAYKILKNYKQYKSPSDMVKFYERRIEELTELKEHFFDERN